MDKLTKLGLSALAGSLVAVSANAGEMTVSGSASISFSDGDVDEKIGTTAEGNQWTMGDSLTFKGSGELDNGMTVSVSYEYDDDEGDLNGGGTDNPGFDSHSIKLSSDEMGTLTFAGHGGATAMDSMDDKTPNAYEESWDGVTNADEETIPNGITGNNAFHYSSPDFSGATLTVGFVPSGESKTPNGHYMDIGITVKPEMVEGLELGFAMGETEETAGTTVDEQALYAKYSYGSLTVGAQISETDGPAAANDVEFEAFGVTYAVTDDFTIGYNQSTSDLAGNANDQEAEGMSASFTSGGITVGGMINDVDNVSNGTEDTEGYELNISFAF